MGNTLYKTLFSHSEYIKIHFQVHYWRFHTCMSHLLTNGNVDLWMYIVICLWTKCMIISQPWTANVHVLTCRMDMHNPSVYQLYDSTDHMHNDGSFLVELHYPSYPAKFHGPNDFNQWPTILMQLVCYINISIVTESCSFVSALGSIKGKLQPIKSNEAIVSQHINSPLSKQQATVAFPSSCFLMVTFL